ncbi:MAG TPA: phosphate ABC transporter substrate-binding protein [bacterium]
MRRIATLALACAFVLALAGAAGAQTGGFKIVVNKDNPARGLAKGKIAFMFMKMTTRWDHGVAVAPVDQAPASAVRAAFSREIHGRDVEAIEAAWQRAVFAGRGTPPPEARSDEDVIAHVAGDPGGIGYVSAGANTDRVKVLEVLQ